MWGEEQVRAAALSVVVVLSTVTSVVALTGGAGAVATATLAVSDQTGDGTELNVTNASANTTYYLQVSERDGATINTTGNLSAGTTFSGNLTFDRTLTRNTTLSVGVYNATDGSVIENQTMNYTVRQPDEVALSVSGSGAVTRPTERGTAVVTVTLRRNGSGFDAPRNVSLTTVNGTFGDTGRNETVVSADEPSGHGHVGTATVTLPANVTADTLHAELTVPNTSASNATTYDVVTPAEIRAATEAYRNVSNATAAGYQAGASPTFLDSDAGAAGVHFQRANATDDLDPLRPTSLVYDVNQTTGEYELVAVGWTADIGFDLFGQAADATGGPGYAGHDEHALHAWLFRDNPDGVFAQWNPAIDRPELVSVSDQLSDGRNVTVDEAVLPSGGRMIAVAGNRSVGASERLDPGRHRNVTVTLEGMPSGQQSLYAVAATEDGPYAYRNVTSLEGATPFAERFNVTGALNVDDASITASPDGPRQDAAHRVTMELSENMSVQTYRIDYAATDGRAADVADVDASDIVTFGEDTDGDGSVEEDYTDANSSAGGINAVNVDADGEGLTVTTNTSQTVAAENTLVLAVRDAVNPSGNDTVHVALDPREPAALVYPTLELGENPTVERATVSGAPINSTETAENRSVTVRFSEAMNTSVAPTVVVSGIGDGPLGVAGEYTNATVWNGTVRIPDTDAETEAWVRIHGAVGADGNELDRGPVALFLVDTVATVETAFGDGVIGGAVNVTDLFAYGEAVNVTYAYSTATNDTANATTIQHPERFNTSGIPDGPIVLRATATDRLNNTNVARGEIEVDNTAPVVHSLSARSTSGALNVTVRTDERLGGLNVSVGGATGGTLSLAAFNGTATADGYRYTAVGSPPDGAYTFAVTNATDIAGNVNDSVSLSAATDIDTTAPEIGSVSLTDLEDGDGNVESGDQVEVTAEITRRTGEVASVTADVSSFDSGSVTLQRSESDQVPVLDLRLTAKPFAYTVDDDPKFVVEVNGTAAATFTLHGIDSSVEKRERSVSVPGLEAGDTVRIVPLEPVGNYEVTVESGGSTYEGDVGRNSDGSLSNELVFTAVSMSQTRVDHYTGTFTVGANAAEGSHQINVTVTDQAGNAHTEVGRKPITVSASGPNRDESSANPIGPGTYSDLNRSTDYHSYYAIYLQRGEAVTVNLTWTVDEGDYSWADVTLQSPHPWYGYDDVDYGYSESDELRLTYEAERSGVHLIEVDGSISSFDLQVEGGSLPPGTTPTTLSVDNEEPRVTDAWIGSVRPDFDSGVAETHIMVELSEAITDIDEDAIHITGVDKERVREAYPATRVSDELPPKLRHEQIDADPTDTSTLVVVEVDDALQTGDAPDVTFDAGAAREASADHSENAQSATTVHTAKLDLIEGRNFVSVPAASGSLPLSEINTSNVEAVWTYDDGEWLNWAPGAPGNDFNVLEGGQGYILVMSDDDTLDVNVPNVATGSSDLATPNQQQLDEGWNLVGHYQEVDQPALMAFGSIIQERKEAIEGPILRDRFSQTTANPIHRVYGQADAGGLSYEAVTMADRIETGEAYWMFVEDDEVYTEGPIRPAEREFIA